MKKPYKDFNKNLLVKLLILKLQLSMLKTILEILKCFE